MLIILVLSAAAATHADLVLEAPFVPAPVEVHFPDPVWVDPSTSLLHGEGVIDAYEAPPVMPAAAHVEHDVRSVESRGAVAVEALTRE